MSDQINYLQVSDITHCLRCHQDVNRKEEDFTNHVLWSCSNMEGEAKFNPSGCDKCLRYDQMNNPWWPRRGPAH